MKKTILFLGASLVASQAMAYALLGNNWNYLPAPRVVDFTVNTSTLPAARIDAAASTWSVIDGSCFAWNNAGTNSKTALDDLSGMPADGNDIFRAGSDLTALAVTQSWYLTSAPGETIEWNMQVFDNYVWNDLAGAPPSGSYDLQSVVLHELGHALGLGHSGITAAVMFATIGDGVSKRVLHSDDLEGFEAIYDCVDDGNCDTFAYWQSQGGITFYATFPVIDAVNEVEIRRVAHFITPAADGDVETMRAQYYNANATPAIAHDGTLRTWIYSDLAGEPDAILAGPLDVTTDGFAAAFGAYDVVDLTPLNYSCSAGVPFHIVWEFLPDTEGTDELAILGTSGVSVGSQMYNEYPEAWGWWFTGRGDQVLEVDICYTETPPGNIVVVPTFQDLGRIENGMDVSGTFHAINTGQLDATVNSVAVGNPAHYSASAAGLPAVVAPGDSVEITVTFNSMADTVFRDTTTVFVDWDQAARLTTEFGVIAGSSECEFLTNDWVGAPDELDWFVEATGDTNILGGSWFFFSGGFDRPTPFVGHPYTAEGDTAASELYTFVDNAGLDNLQWGFANTQSFPADTREHFLLVYGVEEDTLDFLYGFDISDTLFWETAPAWGHITADLDSLPDSVAVSFFYGGENGDTWYIDDVEICRTPGPCDPIEITATKLPGNQVRISWDPFGGAEVSIYESDMAYDFGGGTLLATVDSSVGEYIVATVTNDGRFHRAEVDCFPTARATGPAKIREHPRQQDRLPVSSLRGLEAVQSSRDMMGPVMPAKTTPSGISRTR